MKVKWSYCKYCGARLRRDPVGQYCPTKSCQWHQGLPKEDDTPSKTYFMSHTKKTQTKGVTS